MVYLWNWCQNSHGDKHQSHSNSKGILSGTFSVRILVGVKLHFIVF